MVTHPRKEQGAARRITRARWTKPIDAFVMLGKKQGLASGPGGEEIGVL
jgi:hypothetical protein